MIVGAGAPSLISEYEQLVRELTSLLANFRPANVTAPTIIDQLADLNSGDLDFLAGETGEDRRSLKLLTTAAALEKTAAAEKLALPAAVFYGLARKGMPLDLAGLVQHSAQELRSGDVRDF